MCELCRAFGDEYKGTFHSDPLQPASGAGETGYSGPAPAYATATGIGATGDKNVDGLLSGYRWTGTVTYSFPDSSSDYHSGYAYGAPTAPGFGQISATQQAAVHKIMGQVESLTNLNIDYTGTNVADIRIAQSSEANPTAYAYYPNSTYSEGGDIWFGTSYNYTNPKLGDYYWHTHIHEIGHSLGLKHGQSTDGVANTALPADRDALEFSVMTYRSYVGASTTGGYTNEAFGYPQSFMMNDIIALQTMYGADYTFNNGATVYSWSATTGETFVDGAGQGRPGGDGAGASANRVFITVWDGGGEDTYDLSNYSNAVTVDLRPGSWSTTSNVQKAYLGNGHYAQGNVYNAYLFQDDPSSYIENAIGGSGNDILIGNAVANRLDGGLGADTLTGGAGDDVFVYRIGGGSDVVTDFIAGYGTEDKIDLVGFSNIASFAEAIVYASQVGNNTVFNFGAGSALTLLNALLTVLAADDFTFDSEEPAGPNEAPTAISLSNDTVSENAVGGVVGWLSVLDPNGDVSFSFDVSDARFQVVGNSGSYQLKLKDGVSIDYEAESNIDVVVTAIDSGGLSFTQEFTLGVLDAQGVAIVGTGSKDTIDSVRSAKWQPLPTPEDDTIYGMAGNDVVRGLTGNDYIDGGIGNDMLYGDDGDDTLIGGAGADKRYGGDGDDTSVISGSDDASDTFSGDNGTDTILVVGSGAVTLARFVAAASSIEVWDGNGNVVLGTSKANVLDFSGLNAVTGLLYVDGGSGNDTIIGTNFADDLRGGAGRDQLFGGDGDDVLIGGAGNDQLHGGASANTFVFAESGSKNRDTIFDYNFAEGDAIDLSALLDANFNESSLVSDFVRLALSGNDLLVQIDANGTAGGASFADVAVLSGYSTAGVDQVLVQFEQQAHILAA